MCFSVCIINRGQVKGFVEKKSLEREKFFGKIRDYRYQIEEAKYEFLSETRTMCP